MARGYTTPDLVAAALGVTFTPEQAAACEEQIAALEAHLDRLLRYRWLVAAPGEVTWTGPLYQPVVTLGLAPLATVTSVQLLSPWLTADPYPLETGVGYAVESYPEALLRISPVWCAPARWGRVAVAYTQPVGEDPPPDVVRACTLTVAAWMAPSVPAAASGAGGAAAAAAAGVKRYSVGQELTVEFADQTTGTATSSSGLAAPVPPAAQALLVPYGYPPQPVLA